MRFSFIDKIILSANNKYDRIQDFYDRIGEIGYKNHSPYYWLQYAIAALSYKDYKSAERFFAESKRIASQRSEFYTYQIDNAYAKFLLQSRQNSDLWNDHFDAFAEAGALSMKQTFIRETGLYPYRVATEFFKFIEVRGGSFTRKQKSEASDVCKSWLSRLDSLPAPLKKSRLVRDARSSVADSLDYLTAG